MKTNSIELKARRISLLIGLSLATLMVALLAFNNEAVADTSNPRAALSGIVDERVQLSVDADYARIDRKLAENLDKGPVQEPKEFQPSPPEIEYSPGEMTAERSEESDDESQGSES